ncbi:response regulator transcription factor [Ramlibacter sp. WS9]|uniref:response regulator transcription factor n=1 Tax=Ramlibacter sp. WS9 TaxID=1882741 RepID=UPI0011425FFD|nr:response regulator [Ramlibacter sp. WS9]ROZ66233.1 response regulator [Ramlibacter sp. WS9]
MPEAPLVAIVDDDSSMREATSNFLQAAGLSTVTFEDASSFLQSARRRSAACLVTDVRMPGITGFELYQKLVASGEAIPTVLMTAYLNDSVRARAREAGMVCCLGKPFAPEELLDCVLNALAGGRQCGGETGEE